MRFLLSVGRSISHAIFTENNSSPSAIEFGDVENWQADSENRNYRVNRSIANEYRGADRSEARCVVGASAKTNLRQRNRRGEKGRSIKRFNRAYGAYR